MILTITSFSNVTAATNVISDKNDGVTIYYNNDDPESLTDSSYEEPKERKFVTEEFAKSQQSNEIVIQNDYGVREYSTVKKTEYHTKITTPTGQNPGGMKFSTGGGFYVNLDGGYNTSFTLGSSWGPIDYSVSVGYAKTYNIGGVLVLAPSTKYYYKAMIDRTIRLRHVLVDRYQYGSYKYSYWTTWKDVYRERAYAQRVN